MGLQLDRDGAVEVLHEGRWLSGRLLHAYRRDDGRWRGIVRYTAGVGAVRAGPRPERHQEATRANAHCHPCRRASTEEGGYPRLATCPATFTARSVPEAVRSLSAVPGCASPNVGATVKWQPSCGRAFETRNQRCYRIPLWTRSAADGLSGVGIDGPSW